MKESTRALKEFLDFKRDRYNDVSFIEDDPISIPHLFSKKKDIECIGLIMATISWGNRRSIIKNGHQLVEIMGNEPYDYVINASESELKELSFVHRTFNAADLSFFVRGIRSVYQNTEGGLEAAFLEGNTTADRITNFRNRLFEVPHEKRSEKHVSNPLRGSASKRLNMYLRWMVRNDNRGVDFGIWNQFGQQNLYIPLDVHTGNVARKLGLIARKANDWKALEELMTTLRIFDPSDPCKYDFALFGIGVNGELP